MRISRRSDGWSTTGLIATFGDVTEAIIANSPAELVAKLEAARVERDRIAFCGAGDGDRAISDSLQAEISQLLNGASCKPWRIRSRKAEQLLRDRSAHLSEHFQAHGSADSRRSLLHLRPHGVAAKRGDEIMPRRRES